MKDDLLDTSRMMTAAFINKYNDTSYIGFALWQKKISISSWSLTIKIDFGLV